MVNFEGIPLEILYLISQNLSLKYIINILKLNKNFNIFDSELFWKYKFKLDYNPDINYIPWKQTYITHKLEYKKINKHNKITWAINYNYPNLFTKLVDNFFKAKIPYIPATWLIEIIEYNNLNFIKIFFNKISEYKYDLYDTDDSWRYLYFFACYKGSLDIFEFLFNKKQEIDFEYAGYSALYIACENNNHKIVDFLLKNGALNLINKTAINGKTPLYIACQNNCLESVEILLKNGANINQKCHNISPLEIAGHQNIIKILMGNN